MALATEARELLDRLGEFGFSGFEGMSVEEARELTNLSSGLGTPEEVAGVEDLTISGPAGDIPARLYRPSTDPSLPIVVYFHGGGFVLGGIESHDGLTRSLANAAGALVLSIDYRLAPEHPFPAAPDDCYAATAWAAEHAVDLGGDGARVAVAGDSAGGNLSTVVALMARDRGGPELRAQVLIYPVTAHVTDDASMVDNAEGYLLSRDEVRWFEELYVRGRDDLADPYCSPIRAESLEGLPPAIVVTAEHDPLRDQGDAYAHRLAEAGVPTTHLPFEGMFHGFLNFAPFLEPGRDAVARVSEFLRAAFTLD